MGHMHYVNDALSSLRRDGPSISEYSYQVIIYIT